VRVSPDTALRVCGRGGHLLCPSRYPTHCAPSFLEFIAIPRRRGEHCLPGSPSASSSA